MMERPPEAPRMERELSVEEAEALMRTKLSERIAEEDMPRYASFALPITPEGEPLLFVRKNNPSAGLYSIVGGKLDEGRLTQVSGSESSTAFLEGGFETPTNGLLRELDEELYAEALTARGLTYSEGRRQFLAEQLKPSRQAFVYDAPNNAFNALYFIQTPADLGMQIDPRELGNMKRMRDLKPTEISPLTRFFLNLSGHTHRGMDDIAWGPVKHLPTPEDVISAAIGGRVLEFSHEPKTPSYIIQYLKQESPQ